MPKEIIKRGAEAILYLVDCGDQTEPAAARAAENAGSPVLVKERLKKGYRIQELDSEIRKQRTRWEARLLDRAARAGVPVPRVMEVDESRIMMEFISGTKVKEALNGLPAAKRIYICNYIGKCIAKLHSAGIIHGDLTTSNMIMGAGEQAGDKGLPSVWFVDFGLGKVSGKIEDQAVDLHLLWEALKAAHHNCLGECWDNVIKAYAKDYRHAADVLRRVEKIKKRRRYMGD
jgi:TP53 regulating kinase-like protein